ncbi:putative sporulation protein YtxC [Oceanobacillus manasiensis]|uniref:putative sporulation protein YtxC n=1 Tax=Oceanobacillus manasiensis TaxID=586413 RepID=UPI0005A64F96|nr:putative sporulation protein YtxC [Oceanobacillus manasiensis]
MLEVYFESDKEVIRFCEQLFRYNKKIELHWKTNKDWGNHLLFEKEINTNELFDAVSKAMVEVFVTHRLTAMINAIIEGYYYYTDRDEKEKILELTQWIFAGEDDDSLRVRKDKDPRQLLMSLFISNIKNTSTVHYDSIVKFRLNSFKDKLVHYVGLAIDEFKREEDHQEFVYQLREYVEKKNPSFKIIHILQGDPFSFFKQNGKRLSKMELRMLMQKEPLYIVGLDEEELNLAPLVAMAPEKIKIYGDHPSEPKTLTVINVFQERVDFEPYSNFPFSFYLNNRQK